jgi:hypothetical protein
MKCDRFVFILAHLAYLLFYALASLRKRTDGYAEALSSRAGSLIVTVPKEILWLVSFQLRKSEASCGQRKLAGVPAVVA